MAIAEHVQPEDLVMQYTILAEVAQQTAHTQDLPDQLQAQVVLRPGLLHKADQHVWKDQQENPMLTVHHVLNLPVLALGEQDQAPADVVLVVAPAAAAAQDQAEDPGNT